jgi:EAL domain-containing protein (putative c-di-GMP-specific phosphodiesterase class I)
LKFIDLPDLLAERIDANGLERTQFIFEITESSLLEKSATPMEVLARMRIMGFELSIDDFGTGHSNIENLRDFPFNELKIDRSFVTNLDTDEFSQESVRASIQLSKKLGLRIVAEGIETQNVLKMITKMGVDQVQGHLIGRPMPPDDFKNWLMECRNRSIVNAGFFTQKFANC